MFHPPKPETLPKRPSAILRFKKNIQSSISVFTDHSYQMKMGEVRGLKERTYFLVQPDLVRKLLTSSPDVHPKSDFLEKILDQMVGHGIFVAAGETWARRRKMVDSAFGAANITRIFPHMLAAAQDLGNRMHAGKTRIDTLTTHVAADIIFRTLFSEPLEADEANFLFEAFESFQSTAYAHGNWCMAGLPQRLSPFRRKAQRPAHILREALALRVDARLEAREKNQPVGDDLLDALIEARDEQGVAFTRDELVDEVAVMFLAGHETSASALAWAFYLIANSPNIQDRLHAEIDLAMGGDTLERGHFRKLPLVRDVFRETLRLYPPITFVPRKTTQTETWRDKVLKPGVTIFASLWLLQRHRQIWENPDGFDPDRFSTPEGKQASREAYYPFSIGPRVCPGASFAMQEAAIVMAVLLQKYRFSPTEHVPRPVSKLTLRSENGIELIVTPRAP